jgi:hypothetical protein
MVLLLTAWRSPQQPKTEEEPMQIVKIRSTGEWVVVPDRPKQPTPGDDSTVTKANETHQGAPLATGQVGAPLR